MISTPETSVHVRDENREISPLGTERVVADAAEHQYSTCYQGKGQALVAKRRTELGRIAYALANQWKTMSL